MIGYFHTIITSMAFSLLRELLSESSDPSGCFCVDCGRTFDEDHDDCPECAGHTIDRSQR